MLKAIQFAFRTVKLFGFIGNVWSSLKRKKLENTCEMFTASGLIAVE